MLELKNIIMFTGENCSGCKVMKNLMDRENVKLKIIVDTSSVDGMLHARKYRVQSLPTFVNVNNMEMIIGTASLNQLTELNNV